MDKYLYKEYYFMNSFTKKLIFNKKVNNEYKDYVGLIDKRLEFSNDSSIDFVINKKENIKQDGYEIDITNRYVHIFASTNRGIRYAIYTLNSLLENDVLPIVYIKDEPSFLYRGIIEGYYGKPWTYEERMDMVDFMDSCRLNVYMYAPKDDIYHRDLWYELYPKNQLKEILHLKDKLEEKDIEFVYCISPGNKDKNGKGFEYSNEKEFDRLFKKLDQVIEKGVRSFGLLLDDIDYELSGENLVKFKRPGVAHAYICNRVYDYLISIDKNIRMVMCPTEYREVGRTIYRDDLKANMNKNISVFWTGYNVCAEVISEEQIKETKEAFGADISIWDNFPVTDYFEGSRQYLAPIENRSVELSKYASSYIINPMNEYYISEVAMSTMADYAWNSSRYMKDISFKNALKRYGEDFYNDCLDYVWFNYPSVLNYGNIRNEEKLVDGNKNQEILEYYSKAATSARKMLTYNLKIVDELRPWLVEVIKEKEIVLKIINQTITNDDLYDYFKRTKLQGSKLLDYLIKNRNLLSDEEYNEFITSKRAGQKYHVWEKRK